VIGCPLCAIIVLNVHKPAADKNYYYKGKPLGSKVWRKDTFKPIIGNENLTEISTIMGLG
jgi:hypothetical protein